FKQTVCGPLMLPVISGTGNASTITGSLIQPLLSALTTYVPSLSKSYGVVIALPECTSSLPKSISHFTGFPDVEVTSLLPATQNTKQPFVCITGFSLTLKVNCASPRQLSANNKVLRYLAVKW